MSTVTIPNIQKPITDGSGSATKPWYQYLSSLSTNGQNIGSLQAEITALQETVANIHSGFTLRTIDSVTMTGSSAQGGLVTVSLLNDMNSPSALSFYGSVPEDSPGWYGFTSNFSNNAGSLDLSQPAVGSGGTMALWGFDAYGRLSESESATTDDLTEGSNLYFTAARVLATILSGLSTATSAAITAADSVLSAFGKLQSQITALAASLTGYVPTTTTITAGTGLSGGGDLSANRTLSLANTAVTAASYGDATHVATFTVDAQGRLTAAGSVAISASITPLYARFCTPGALPANTYSNGASGVGATLTMTTAAVLTIDGGTPALNDFILVNMEATSANNGLYQLTTVGTGSVLAVLTRSASFDTPAQIPGAQISVGPEGAAFGSTVWLCTTAQAPTIGTTAITFNNTAIVDGEIRCRLATAAALPANTYNNGSSGVNATLTMTATGILTVDGVQVGFGDNVLVRNEATASNNGVYKVTTAGAVGVAAVLTRSQRFNVATQISAALISVGPDSTANANTLWQCSAPTLPTPVIGTTTITFALVGGGAGGSTGSSSTQLILVQPGATASIASDLAVWFAPYDCNILDILVGALTAPTSGSVTVDIKNAAGTSILSSLPSIGSGLHNSLASPAVINSSLISVAKGDYLRASLTSVGSGASGIVVAITYAASGWNLASSWISTGETVGWSGQTLRQVIPAAALLPGAKMRLTVTAGTSAGCTVINAFVQTQTASGNAYSFSGTPVAITFAGSASLTLAAGASAISDPIAFIQDATKPVIVSAAFSAGNLTSRTSLTGWQAYYKTANDAATVSASGYSTSVANATFITKVEVHS